MKIKINGTEREVNVSPETPLLWVIREELKMTGTKFGCGMGLCGACTVHQNGVAIRSCITPVSSVVGMEITTIEGIGDEQNPHPLQQAWQDLNVPQCGYCQSGQLMSASALLAQNPNPSDSDIVNAMSGNICRCGTYPRIKKAIKVAAGNLQASVVEFSPVQTSQGAVQDPVQRSQAPAQGSYGPTQGPDAPAQGPDALAQG